MTPLAMHIAKQALLPEQSRFNDEANVLSSMGDIHCFEVSEIVDLASELAAQYPAYGAPDALMFLPAPKTWIEHKTSYGRVAFLLEESDDGFLRTEVWLGRNGKLGSYRFSRCVSKDQPRLVDETNDRMKRLNGFCLKVRRWTIQRNGSALCYPSSTRLASSEDASTSHTGALSGTSAGLGSTTH